MAILCSMCYVGIDEQTGSCEATVTYVEPALRWSLSHWGSLLIASSLSGRGVTSVRVHPHCIIPDVPSISRVCHLPCPNLYKALSLSQEGHPFFYRYTGSIYISMVVYMCDLFCRLLCHILLFFVILLLFIVKSLWVFIGDVTVYVK